MEPNSPHVLMLHTFVLASVGDKDELGRLQFPPDHTYLTRIALLYRAAALGDIGTVDGLVDEDVERTARRDPDGALWLAEVYGCTGRTDEAFGWLEQAVERGHLDYPYIAEYSPFLTSLRETDRFQRLSQRLRQAWEDFDA